MLLVVPVLLPAAVAKRVTSLTATCSSIQASVPFKPPKPSTEVMAPRMTPRYAHQRGTIRDTAGSRFRVLDLGHNRRCFPGSSSTLQAEQPNDGWEGPLGLSAIFKNMAGLTVVGGCSGVASHEQPSPE